MIDVALRARLPMVKLTTTDPMSVVPVLAFLCPGLKVVEVLGRTPSAKDFSESDVVVLFEADEANERRFHDWANTMDATAVLVNVDGFASALNVGALPTPPGMVHELLDDAGVAEEAVTDVARLLGGLTLNEIRQVCAVTSARAGSLAFHEVERTRRELFGDSMGLQSVPVDIPFYYPHEVIEAWLESEGVIFQRDNVPETLVPRGLLLGGPPGTGKTLGAKHIAATLGVPLYRLNIGAILGKYVGDSEANMSAALGKVDQASPCVLLLDEVEKLFGGHDESGVTPRLLSSLLWWLQEHTSRVITVMTSNNIDALPRELYRPGRIDRVVWMDGLPRPAGRAFCMQLLDSFGPKYAVLKKSLQSEFSRTFHEDVVRPHVDYTGFVGQLIKEWLVKHNPVA